MQKEDAKQAAQKEWDRFRDKSTWLEPQEDEDDLVIHVDGEDADRVDDLDAGPRPAHPHAAVDETFWRGETEVKMGGVRDGLLCTCRGKRRIMVSSRFAGSENIHRTTSSPLRVKELCRNTSRNHI